MKKLLAGCSTVITAAAVPTLAFAHPGLDHVHSLGEGLQHPLGGIDHVAAMVAVGLIAAQLSGRALWITPLSFMALMIVGAGLGLAHVALPATEIGIALSVVVLGVVLLFGAGLPTLGAAALVGFFALFHGYAHGAEMPDAASALSYGAGFLAATALLHLVGIAAGLLARRSATVWRPRLFRVAGASFALIGLTLLPGAL